jgi:hypothetical protein
MAKTPAKKVTQIVSADPFTAIAKSAPVSTAKSKSTKPTANVTDEIKNSVDLVIQHKAEIKRLEAELTNHETSIIDHVRPQQDDNARSGAFSKSYEVPGNNGALTYVTSDRFSCPKEPAAIDQLKTLLGLTRFEEWFENKRTTNLQPGVLENPILVQKLVKAAADAGMSLGDVFDVVDTLVAKSDLDQKQYALKPAQLDEFRTLVRQNKPALKS